MANKIKNISINLSSISEAGELRNFSVTGDVGATFILIVADASGKFYDFKTNTFSLGHTPQKILKKTLFSKKYNGIINFPSVAGQNYDIILIGDPATHPEGFLINKRIKQLGNTTLTFSLAPRANTSSFKTLPGNITSVSSPGGSAVVVKNVDYTIENADTDANGFGLIFSPSNISNVAVAENAFYFQTTTTVDGAVSSEDKVKLDSLNNIAVGMVMTSGASSGTPTVTDVNSSTGQITLSSAQNFSDGASVTIEAQGLPIINDLLNCNISASFTASVLTAPTTTVRGVVGNSTTITVNGTYGIPGNGVAVYTGTNVNNSSGNKVASVSASSSAGSFVTGLAQTFKGSEVLTFTHGDAPAFELADTLRIQGNITTSNFPTNDATIKIDLDTLITPGVAS